MLESFCTKKLSNQRWIDLAL